MKPLHYAGLGVALLIVAQLWASFVTYPLRPEVNRVEQGAFFAELPPGEVAGTLMLGGFRGMAIDFLWLRAVKAKDEARYYESVALFELISRVQPRFEKVWEYMAWDMAYNIGFYVDQDDDKWSWYLAGLKANLRGVELNPDSERLLRHLAWMYFHKGDNFMPRIEATDWGPVIGDAVASYQADMPMPAGASLSSFALAEYFYRLSVFVSEREQDKQPAFVRRMVPLSIDRDANRLRNRGKHFIALQRYVDALAAWQDISNWAVNPSGHFRPGLDQELTDESYQRNEGLLRRKMVALSARLSKAEETARLFARAVMERNIEQCRYLLAQPGTWRETITSNHIRWLDEMAQVNNDAQTDTP